MAVKAHVSKRNGGHPRSKTLASLELGTPGIDSCAKFAKEESLTLRKKFDVIYNEIVPQHELPQQTIKSL
jgi:hypothetical protein